MWCFVADWYFLWPIISPHTSIALMQSTANILGTCFLFRKLTADSFRDFSPAHFTTFAAYQFKQICEDFLLNPWCREITIYFFIRTWPSRTRRYYELKSVYEHYFHIRHYLKKREVDIWTMEKFSWTFHCDMKSVGESGNKSQQAFTHWNIKHFFVCGYFLKSDLTVLISPGFFHQASLRKSTNQISWCEV